MDFIFMLTRHDRTIDDAEDIIDLVSDIGVRHIGFKDIGVPRETLERVVERIRAHQGICYLEVVSTTPDAVTASLATGATLGVDCILGGTDLDAAGRVLGTLARYFPFPGRPVGHPTRLEGTPAQVEHAQVALAERDALGGALGDALVVIADRGAADPRAGFVCVGEHRFGVIERAQAGGIAAVERLHPGGGRRRDLVPRRRIDSPRRCRR